MVQPKDYHLYHDLLVIISKALDEDERATIALDAIWPVLEELVGRLERDLSVPSQRLWWR